MNKDAPWLMFLERSAHTMQGKTRNTAFVMVHESPFVARTRKLQGEQNIPVLMLAQEDTLQESIAP